MWRTRWCEGSTQDVTPKAQPSEYLLNPYRLNWWETVPSNTLYQSQHRKVPSMNQNSLFHKREVRRRLSFWRQWWQWQQRRHRRRRPHSDSRTWLTDFNQTWALTSANQIMIPNSDTGKPEEGAWVGFVFVFSPWAMTAANQTIIENSADKAWRGCVNRLRLCVFI